jgi:protein ImuB
MRSLAEPNCMDQPLTNAVLYACLYAKDFCAQALLRLRPELRSRACVVLDGEPPLRQVCSLNSQARALGVAPGMAQAELDIFSGVSVLTRARAEEEATRSALLDCAGAFSPRIEDRSRDDVFLCVIDIAGTGRLFSSPQALAAALLDRVRTFGIQAYVAVSCNFHAAICLARGMSPKKNILIVPRGEETAALSALPLNVLELTRERAETFSLWGIHTLGMLAALPEKPLIARMGQDGKRLSELARGKHPHLFLPVEPAFKLEERMELDMPVELLTSLLFVIGVMLEQLILRAAGRALALASVTIHLSLENQTEHERTIRPAIPSNDRQLWLKLIHLDLEAHPPQAAILSLIVSAEPGRTSKVQLGLFSTQLPEPARLDVTLARLRSIVGENNVGRAVLSDTHRPNSYQVAPFSVPSGTATGVVIGQPRAVLRQLRPAESTAVTLRERRPMAFFFREKHYAVERAYGPWLSSGEWWNPTLWSLEQWDLIARSHEGSVLYCCLAHDIARNSWQVVALYD